MSSASIELIAGAGAANNTHYVRIMNLRRADGQDLGSVSAAALSIRDSAFSLVTNSDVTPTVVAGDSTQYEVEIPSNVTLTVGSTYYIRVHFTFSDGTEFEKDFKAVAKRN